MIMTSSQSADLLRHSIINTGRDSGPGMQRFLFDLTSASISDTSQPRYLLVRLV